MNYKRALFIWVWVALANLGVAQDCPSDSLTISNQIELEQFLTDYPDCNRINATLSLTGVSDLTPLMNIDSIFGSLTIIECNNLESLQGLNGLMYIEHNLIILNNERLTDIGALNQLTHTGNEFGTQQYDCSIVIANNNGLEDITGFENLIETGLNGICITSNINLNEITGFNNIESTRALTITSNQNLTKISGFQDLQEIGLPFASSSLSFENELSLGNSRTLNDISGLSNLRKVRVLRVNNCPNLARLPFDDGLIVDLTLNLSNSGLTSLDNVKCAQFMHSVTFNNMSSMEDLSALSTTKSVDQGFNLDSLPLITNLNDLRCIERAGRFNISSMVGILNMDGLNNLNLVTQYINIENNENLQSLEGLNSIDTIGQLSLANFRPLQIINNDKLKSLSGLRSLDYLLTGLRVEDNALLEDISVFESVTFDRFFSSSNFLASFRNNPILKKCDYLYICNGLVNDAFSILNNDTLCHWRTIPDQCNQFPSVNIAYYLDDNGNGIKDEREIYYYDSSVEIIPSNDIYYITEPIGPRLFLAEGEYSFVPHIDEQRWQITSSNDNVNLNQGEHKIIEIGIKAKFDETKLQKNIEIQTRCNTEQLLFLKLKNKGTTTVSGTMWISNYPQDFTDKLELQADTIVENMVGFHINNLSPSYSFRRNIELNIPGPPETEIGEQIAMEMIVSLDQSDYNDELYTFNRNIRCSWDPNDKLVLPNRNENQIVEEDTLIYTIRFQNTGNDYAEQVTIIDTLNENLDLSTLNILNSSHPEKLIASLTRNVLTLDFPYIFLPDSISDNARSQGFVKFSILPFAGSLSDKDKIVNTAEIYFDQNPPIRTNTVESIYVNNLTSVGEEFPTDLFFVYPNPTKSDLKFSYSVESCSVFDLHGRLIYHKKLNGNSVSLKHLEKGIYFLQIKKASISKMTKIILH